MRRPDFIAAIGGAAGSPAARSAGAAEHSAAMKWLHRVLVVAADVMLACSFVLRSLAQLHQAGALIKKVASLKQAGKYAEAILLAQRALAVSEKALGPDDPNLAATLNNLTFLYYPQGRCIEAEPLSKRMLAIQKKALVTTGELE
jgi:hypothetical protein